MSNDSDHDSHKALNDAAAERRHDRFLLLLYLLGSVISAALLIELAARSDYIGRPYETEWLSIWQVVGFALLAALFFPCCMGVRTLLAEIPRLPGAAVNVLTVLLIPVVLAAGWSLLYRGNHVRQTESLAAFDRYYQRIPDGKLGPPFVNWHDETDNNDVEVCADLGKQDDSDFICALMDLDHPDGYQVVGGFEATNVDVYDEAGYFDRAYEGVRNCWGEVYICDLE